MTEAAAGEVSPALSGWRPVAVALLVGAAGGWLFTWLRLPLPWMLGAMCATTAVALAGFGVRVPRGLRAVMIAVLGAFLGSAFTPEIAEQLKRWLASLSALVVYVAAAAGAVFVLLRRAGGFGRATSYFAAAPGGLAEMIAAGAALGGDERTISLIHSVRVLLVVLAIPLWFRFFHGYVPPSVAAMTGPAAALGGRDIAILLACAGGGWALARLLRLPAAELTGPMILSAAAHVAGLTVARPPGEVVAVAQVVVGAAIGGRFAGVSLRAVFGTVRLAVVATALMVTAAAAFAAALEAALGLPFVAVLLAFAPGGLAEMCLISFALGIDTAFVSTHHFIRIVLLVILAPIAFRLAVGQPRG